MVKVHLKYVNAFEDRAGLVRYYFRRNGNSYPLPADETSREFLAEHQRLLLLTDPVVLPQKVAAKPGTFADLTQRYYASAGFQDMAPKTRHHVRATLDRFIVSHGHRMVRQLRRSDVMAIVGKMGKTPGAANYFLKRLKTLCEFAIALEWISSNPCHKVKGYKAGEHATWDEDQIAKFEAAWPIGSFRRLAFDVLLYTGQRVSDAAAMPVPDQSGKVRIAQIKTGARLALAMHPNLMKSIAAHPSGHLTILVTKYGKPYSAAGLSKLMAESIQLAKLPPGTVAHGLRKAAARRLAEAGCTDKEIMAVTGHTTLQEVTRYTRAASQERLNQAAMDKVSGGHDTP